ncbi:hypothetical protein GCM10009837_84540 [Streptomyces durmitorensis]
MWGDNVAAESGPEALWIAKGLSYLCGHLGEVRELLNDDGALPGTPLGRLLSVLREGGTGAEVSGLLDMVDEAARRAGDQHGVYGPDNTRRGEPSGMEALQIVFRCPLRLCTGRSAREVGRSVPVCPVSPQRLPLERERL